MTTPAIDVVVLTWNDDRAMLDTAVRSALEQRVVDVRLIVLDNASDEPVLVDDPRITLIRSETNLGVGGGRNHGAQAGGAPFVCFLDSDARLHPESLARLLAEMDHDRIALAAPVFAGQPPEASAGRAPSLADKIRRATNRTDVYRRSSGQGTGPCWDVDFAIGACQLVRRSSFELVGGFDESARFGPEDVDLCLRLRSSGLRVVQVADAGCDHPPRRAFRGLTTAKGLHHARAVVRYLWGTRRVRRQVVS